MGKTTFSDCGRFDGDNFFSLLDGRLDERARRLVAAAVAQSLPYGGITAVSRSSGIPRSVIHDGIHDLAAPEPQPKNCGGRRLRRPGGGRKPILSTDPSIRDDIEKLVQPLKAGTRLSGTSSSGTSPRRRRTS